MTKAGADLGGLGQRNRCTHFHRDGFGHFAGTGGIDLEQLLEESDALFLWRLGPSWERSLGGSDCGIGVGFATKRDHTAGLLGRRIDDVEVVGLGRRDPRTIDIEVAAVDDRVGHGSPRNETDTYSARYRRWWRDRNQPVSDGCYAGARMGA